MTQMQRVTGIESASAHGHGHAVQFYESDDVLAATVAGHLADGLSAGEAALVVALPGHTDAFLREMQAKGVDVARARAGRQLVLLDAEETLSRFSTGDEPDWERFLDTVGGAVAGCIASSPAGRVRAYGEMVDVLWRRGREEAALRLEEMWNRLGGKYPFSLLCAYVLGNFYRASDEAGFRRICDLHQHVVPAQTSAGTADAEAQAREMSRLQQRALALETELLRRKELEEALRCAREQAEAASRAKDEFLAMLGHELRNPLAPILTALELTKVRTDGHVTREHEVIERQTRHLMRLVDDVLDVSRVARGVLELRRQKVDARDVLARAAEVASPLIGIRRQRVEIRAPGRGLLLLDGDESRLSQVLANLLTNAAKYTPPGGHIDLSARSEGAEVVIEVQDDGDGIG